MSALLWGSCVTLAVCTCTLYVVEGGGEGRAGGGEEEEERGSEGGGEEEEEVDYCEGQLEHYVAYWW